MQISIANAIQVARRIGAAAAKVITTNLKMWLGFETSETLGREEVVNGDFATDLSNWSIADSDSTHTVTHTSNGARFKSDTTSPLLTFTSDTANIVSGRSYEIKVVISEYQGSSGIKIQNSATGSVNYLFDSVDTFTYSFTAVSNSSNPIQFYRNGANVDITIESVSLKELTQFTPDKSGNNNVGELFTGKAIELDGVNDEIGFGTTQIPVKTISFWIKPLSISNEGLFYLGLSGFPQFRQISITSGNITATSYLTNFTPYVNNIQTSAVTQDVWQRVVLTFDEWTTTSIQIGKVYSSVYGHFVVSDVQFYNETWSTDDIAYDYANPQNLVTDRSGTSIGLSNLKGYWHLSEGDGLVAYDSSGEGNNGTINGATYEPAQPRIPQLGMMNWAKSTPVSDEVTLIPNPNNTSQDIFGNAVRDRLNSFNLDGIGYAEVADDTDLDIGTGAFTMECWVKADFENTGSGFNNIFILGGEISDTNTASISINSTKLLAQVSDKELTADSNYTIGDWYHVCVTRNGSNLCTLYIDAEAQADTETTSASITNTSTKLIGRDTLTTRFYKNLISDVRLYKGKALSLTEIENNYNAGLSAHTN